MLQSKKEDPLESSSKDYSSHIKEFVHESNLSIGIWRLDDLDAPSSLRLVYANKSIDQYSSYKKLETLVGLTFKDAFPGLLDTGYPEWLVEVIRSGKAGIFDNLVAKNTQFVDLIDTHWSIHAVPLPDQCVGIIAHDITERKKVEMERKVILDNIPVCVVMFDSNLNVKWGNKCFADVFNLDLEDMVGKFWYDLVPPMIKRKPTYDRVLAGESIETPEAAIPFPEGIRYFNVKYSPIKNDYGSVIGMIVAALEITKEKNFESEKQMLIDRVDHFSNELNKQQKKHEKIKIRLKRNEKIILTALTCYPNYNDRQIAELTGLNRSTITHVRRRLQSKQWYKKIIIPDIETLGYEVLVLNYYLSENDFDKDNAADFSRFLKKDDSCVFAFNSKNMALGLKLYRNYTAAHNSLVSMVDKGGFSSFAKDIWDARFFVKATEIPRLFDYSHILRELFPVTFPPNSQHKNVSLIPLKFNEKKLIYALTKFPEAKIDQLRWLTGLSKPTIIKIRKNLFDRGVIRFAVIPNLQKLGLSFSCFIKKEFSKNIFLHKKFSNENNSFRILANTVLVSQERYIALGSYRDYSGLHKEHLKQKKLFKEKYGLHDEPEKFYLEGTKIVKMSFADLVKGAFDLDVNY